MYEITLNPEDYGIDALSEGLGNTPVPFAEEDRVKWSREIDIFADKLSELHDKAQTLKHIFESDTTIQATPASLKALKIQLFHINDALQTSMDVASQLEGQIVKK